MHMGRNAPKSRTILSDLTSQRPSTPRRRPKEQSSRPSFHDIDYAEDKEPAEIWEKFVIEASNMEHSKSEIHPTTYALDK